MSNYYNYIHTNTSVKTVGGLSNEPTSPFFGIPPIDILQFKGDNGTLNAERVFSAYTSREMIKKYASILIQGTTPLNETNADSVPIMLGTSLLLPLEESDRSTLTVKRQNVINQGDFKAFLSRQLYALSQQPNYRIDRSESGTVNSVASIQQNFTVWVWSRGKSIDSELFEERNDGTYLSGRDRFRSKGIFSGEEEEKEKEMMLINLTPFVTSVNIQNAKQGGSFTINLSSVSCTFKDGDFTFEDAVINRREDGLFFDSKLHIQGTTERSKDFSTCILQENDIVFIRLSKMNIEKDRDNKVPFFIPITEIPDKFYDMIGLIDNNSLSTNYESTNRSISIVGRDLTKLLIEDGVYFYPIEFIEGMFANERREDFVERFDGKIKTRFQYSFKTIEASLKFLINSLSTIKIADDELFTPYKSSLDLLSGKITDRRSKRFVMSQEGVNEDKEKLSEVSDQIKEIESLIKDSIEIESPNLPTNTNTIRGIRGDISSFLQSVSVNEISGKLTGWENSDGRSNVLPSNLEGRLYVAERKYTDSKGNVVTDRERLNLIDRIKKKAKDIDSLKEQSIPQGTRGKQSAQQIDRESEPDDLQSQIDSGEFMDKIWEENTVIQSGELQDGDRNPLSDRQRNIIEEDQRETQRQIQKLKDELENLRQRLRGIKLTTFRRRFDTLNAKGKQAFEKAWELSKDQTSNKQKKEPEQKEELMRGVWQIFNLLIDDSVKNRRIADSTIGNDHGSIINAIENKIVMEPFAEAVYDTYGDQFYMIVRKPPFDKKSIEGYLYGDVSYEDIEIVTEKQIKETSSPLDLAYKKSKPSSIITKTREQLVESGEEQGIVITVKESDVFSDDLTYGHTGQAYSWYRLTPQNLISSQGNATALMHIKAIYLKEYAEIWGSKPLDVTTNYIPFESKIDKNSKNNLSYFVKQSILDLKWLIDTNAYLPFTRQGSISMIQDRRIKAGNFIRLEGTGEICYVDSVEHDSSVSERSVMQRTTVSVSRCMVEEFISGRNINGRRFSYFDIVDTSIDMAKFNREDLSFGDSTKLTERWKVNEDVFKFFLKKMQFT